MNDTGILRRNAARNRDILQDALSRNVKDHFFKCRHLYPWAHCLSREEIGTAYLFPHQLSFIAMDVMLHVERSIRDLVWISIAPSIAPNS